MLDGFCNQSIGRPLVVMADLRQNLHHCGNTSHRNDLHETDQLILVVRAYKGASLQIRRLFSLYSVEILLVVPKGLALSYWRLVVDLDDTLHEIVIEVRHFDDDTPLCGPSDILSGIRGYSICPPLLIAA